MDSVLSFILIVIILIDMIAGYRKGLIRVTVDIIGTILALYASFRFYRGAGEFISRFISGMSPVVQNIVGFIVVFTLAGIAVEVIGYVLSIIMRLPGLSLLNRFAGAVISVVKTYIILSVIAFMIFSLKIVSVNEVIADSTVASTMVTSGESMYKKAQELIPLAMELIPEDWNLDFFDKKGEDSQSI